MPQRGQCRFDLHLPRGYTLGGAHAWRRLHELYARSRHKFSPRYTTIYREASIGDAFYVLLQGLVRCSSAATGLSAVYGVGATFGEGALLTKVRREATVVALEHCYLLHVINTHLEHTCERRNVG